MLVLVLIPQSCPAGRVVRTNRVCTVGQKLVDMTKRFGFITGNRGRSIRFGYCDAGDSGHVDEAKRARSSRVDESVLCPRIDGQTAKHGWR